MQGEARSRRIFSEMLTTVQKILRLAALAQDDKWGAAQDDKWEVMRRMTEGGRLDFPFDFAYNTID